MSWEMHQYLERFVGPDDRQLAMVEVGKNGTSSPILAERWANRGAISNTAALLLFCAGMDAREMGRIFKMANQHLIERNNQLREALRGRKGYGEFRQTLKSANRSCRHRMIIVDEIMLMDNTSQFKQA